MQSLYFKVEPQEKKVSIVVNEYSHTLNALWLRERALDESHLDALTQQRLFDPHSIDPELKLTAVEQLDANSIKVVFTDGYCGTYKAADFAADFDSDDGLPTVELWQGDIDVSRLTCDYSKLGDPVQLLSATETYLRFGALIIKHVPMDPKQILEVAERFGHVRHTNFGQYFEVYSRPQSNDLAYRPVRLGPHTDNPYRDPVPGVQLLHCLINETNGGLSTLVDSLSVLKQLHKEDPEGLSLLSEVPVKFRFIDDGAELIERRPIVHLDYLGRPTGVHYSPRLDYLPIMGEAKTVAFQRARRRLGELFSDPAFEIRFRLEEGELMMFDNNRVLHGRTSFDPSEGRRHLQGCYIDLDGPRGLFKSLKRKLNAQI
jgi:gamma-butyrobetaine dioxygenase